MRQNNYDDSINSSYHFVKHNTDIFLQPQKSRINMGFSQPSGICDFGIKLQFRGEFFESG